MSRRSMLKFMVVIYKRPGMSSEEFRRHLREVSGPLAHRLPGLRRHVQNHARARSGILQDGTPSSNRTSTMEQRGKLLGQVRRAMPQTPTCRRLLPTSRAPLGRWSMRLWFWNNHQEVIHLVALHKVILLQQLVARLRCLTKYNIA